MPRYDLFTIGHSNIPADRFIAMLRDAEVNAVADVRSVPNSRWFPWFSPKPLADEPRGRRHHLHDDGRRARRPPARQQPLSRRRRRLRSDGGRARICRRPGSADSKEAARSRVCLMCAERDPLDCHRCLLDRAAPRRTRTSPSPISFMTAQSSRMPRPKSGCLRSMRTAAGLFASGESERLAAAYRHRAHAVGFKQKSQPNAERKKK